MNMARLYLWIVILAFGMILGSVAPQDHQPQAPAHQEQPPNAQQHQHQNSTPLLQNSTQPQQHEHDTQQHQHQNSMPFFQKSTQPQQHEHDAHQQAQNAKPEIRDTQQEAQQQQTESTGPPLRATTPIDATGHDWIFGANATEAGKRSVNGLQSIARMFSTERSCGFAVQTDRGLVFPWMATLICSRVQCTGTLVSGSLVLTSASCILACGTEPVRILLGDPRLSACGQRQVEILASSAVVNPTFKSSRTADLDVGLVQLVTAVDFNLNPFVYPICLVGVETRDPTIECQVVMGTGQPAVNIQNSIVNCYEPGNEACQTNGLTGTTACVRLNQCFEISTQASVPVICRRTNKSPTRYFLWGVTTSDHAHNTCSCGVARVSDSFSFIAQGLGLN